LYIEAFSPQGETMNRHQKLALFLAPFLLLGGYIASDYYLEYQAGSDKYYQLQVQNHCDVISGNCILESGELLLSLSDEQGLTKLNATFPLDSVVLILVSDDSSQQTYAMEMVENPYYWQVATPLHRMISTPGKAQTIRLVAKIKGGNYLSEFVSATIGS
jgi:hypothetical protein